ncbi:hypothetical protein CC80DRAFT_425430, partial [Byssothecium circinans]
ARIRQSLGDNHEYVFVDGSVPHLKASKTSQNRMKGSYVFRNVDSAQRLYADLVSMIKIEAPFNGVIGFSEGAAVALSLLSMHERLLRDQGSSPFHFKCGIFFCAGAAFDATLLHDGVLRKLDLASGDRAVTFPTAHIWARKDDVHPGFGEVSRVICSTSSVEEYVHELGHTVPGARSDDGVVEAVRAIRRTIERARDV